MIYVDTVFSVLVATGGAQRWCHMWTDGRPEELHVFAARLGLYRRWYQDKPSFGHYDLVPRYREKALAMGATEMPLKEWIRSVQAQRRCLACARKDIWKLRHKNLACLCRIGQPCHRDVLLRIANPRRLR